MSYRFYVESADGRRSNEWLVTVSGPNQADVYVAPRAMMRQLKVSLHESGYCQLGPTRRLRNMISWRFRQALERWHHDRHSVTVSPAFAVVFRDDQLRYPDDESLHSDSIAVPIGFEQELWVLFMIQPEDQIDRESYDPLQLLHRIGLGDGTVLDLLITERPANPTWLEDFASFDPVAVASYPTSLSEGPYSYVVGHIEGVDHLILEFSGAATTNQSWFQMTAESADGKTTEEYVMERLETARDMIEEVLNELAQRGPVWDGHQLSDTATKLAEGLTASLEGLSNLAHIAYVDAADLQSGPSDSSDLAGWLDLIGDASEVCADPSCPHHTISP